MSTDHWFISVDDHVVEPPTLWSERLSAREREAGLCVVQDTYETIRNPSTGRVKYIKGADGPMTDWWIYEQVAKPVPRCGLCLAGIPSTLTPLTRSTTATCGRAATTPSPGSDMDINRTGAVVVFPVHVPRFCGQMFLRGGRQGTGPPMRPGLQRLDDRGVVRFVGRPPDPAVPDPAVGPGGGRRRSAAQRGPRQPGDHLYRDAPLLGLPSIHDPSRYWDPVFDACNDTGTVLCMHIGSGSRMAETSPFAPRAANTALTFSMAQQSLVEWLVSGILVRFPKLKIAYSESQIGWMPFILERLDKVFTHTAFAEFPVITEPPSTYIPDRVFGCFFDDETGVANRDAIGVSQLLFESDYPHQDTTWPHTDRVIEMASQVSAAELEMILRTNALRMLNIT